MLPRLRLRTKLILAFLIVLLPMLGLIAYDYSVGYRQLTGSVTEDQMRTSEAIAVLTDASIDDALSIAWSMSNDPIIRTKDYRQIDPYLEKLAPSLPQYEDVSVLDSDGNNVGSMVLHLAPPDTRPRNADRPYFQALKSTSQPVVSKVVISRVTGNPTAAVVVPMFDESGNFEGATLVALNLDYLAQRVSTVDLRESQAIFVTDEDGTVVFHTGLPHEEWGRRSLAEYAPVRSALEGVPACDLNVVAPQGDVRIVATTRTTNHGWAVGVSIPSSEVLQPLQDELVRRLLAFSAVVVFAGLVAILLSRRIILRPLEVLTDHLVAFGSGRSNGRVDLRTGDEIEQLATAFNRMAEEIRDREEQLRGSEKRFRAMYEEAPHAYFSVSPDGHVRMVNRRAVEMLGYGQDDLVGRHVIDLYADTPAGKHKAQQLFTRFRAGEEIRGEELEMRRANDTPVWISLTVVPVVDAKGSVVESRSMAVDITERKRAEEELAARHRELLTLHRISEIVRNAQSVEVAYQEIVQEISNATGFPIVVIELYDEVRQKMLFKGMTGIPLSADHSAFEVPVEETLSGVVARTGKSMIETSAWERPEYANEPLRRLGVRTFLCVPMWSSQRVIGVISLAHPEVIQLDSRLLPWAEILAAYVASLTERKRVEEALKESEDRYRALFEYANDAIFLHHLKPDGTLGGFVAVNEAACAALGYSRRELLRMTSRDIAAPDAQATVPAVLDRLQAEGHVTFEIVHVAKDGRRIPVEISTRLVVLNGERMVLSIARDITERKRAEQFRDEYIHT
ncbi:MAG: MEKHLA domain-containing protein, partial [Chloroflexi bacterium]|nr:MEKHLA domain-containing protein [Chloroflexota bacterium]